MSDPYIEAQKRLDRGETVCMIDTSLPSNVLNICLQVMSVDTQLINDHINKLNTLKRLELRLSELQVQRNRLI